MTQLKDLVVFRNDLYFDGAVQADWFYQSQQAEAVAKSFVFHGPKNHAVSQSDVGGRGLLDTASFALRLAQKLEYSEDSNALTLAIAGYGTGKSHLAVTLSTLLSGEQWKPELHETILANVARADEAIASQLKPLVKKPRLVLTLNGMRDFNLHYELLRTAEKALRLYGADLQVLTRLNKVKETASVFLEHSFALLADRFAVTAAQYGISCSGEPLKQRLLQALDNELGKEFNIINDVYTEFNGHPIRLDEGVSASQVLDTLLTECCGLHGQFDSIVIFFDEFGRFLEYVSANPAAAGDSALQQIFEAVQNAEGAIQFVGFIQSDIKSYLQRVDKSSNISRYIDRYDAGEKVYLSSNLETIFANLLEKKDKVAFSQLIISRFNIQEEEEYKQFAQLQKWLPLHGIWTQWTAYRRILLEELYPLHPLSTYLLCSLTDWLQSRSSLTLLNEKMRLLGDVTIDEDSPLPRIYPVELLKGAFFDELLNAEEQGRQRSQFCILLNSIYRKFDTKLTENARSVLLGNLILRICRFHFENREELLSALGQCTGLPVSQINEAVHLLEDEYAVLSYDDRLICFDFVADSVGANEFRNFLRSAQLRRPFRAEMLLQNDIQEYADILKPLETDFGSRHGIQTREWAFIQRLDSITNISASTVTNASKELQTHTLPNTERGLVLWLYMSKETPYEKLDQFIHSLQQADGRQAFVPMLLDDADNSLQNAILAYRVLVDMKEEDKLRYQRFYADALGKAKEKVTLLFADLKQQRKMITAEGIVTAEKRLKVALTSVFETIYSRAVPFDFDGFDAKSVNGTAYKNFCTIMKWILMDDMSYAALKSQSSDVKNRVDSLLGPRGLFSWRALSSDYKSISPGQTEVSRLFASLESLLNTKKILPFKQLTAQLTAAPYGMNEYAVFLLLCLFSQQFAYTTRLELNGARYSTSAWAEQVLQDKKFDLKLFSKTKLLLVDVGATVNRYRALYSKIRKNTDFTQVEMLEDALNKLKAEDAVPEALEAEDELAADRLAEGRKFERFYTERISKIDNELQAAKRILNPYSALQMALEAQKLSYESFGSGKYIYTSVQKEQLAGYVEEAKRIAAASFADGWIKRYACAGPEKLGSFKAFSTKAAELFSKYGFQHEAFEFTAKVDEEIKRIQLLIEQEAFLNQCESYLLSSQIRKGMTQKNLAAFQEQANEYIKRFEEFDYQADSHFIDLRSRVQERNQELSDALVEFKEQLDSIWNAIYDISSVEDVRHVHARIEAILSSGLTERDRDDLESIDREISAFLNDVNEFMHQEYSRASLVAACDSLMEHYAEHEFDVSPVIDGLRTELLAKMDRQEQTWKERYLTIEPPKMSQPELNKWQKDTQLLPLFLTPATESTYHLLQTQVENELAKQKIDYILMLYRQLSKEEKELLNSLLQQE